MLPDWSEAESPYRYSSVHDPKHVVENFPRVSVPRVIDRQQGRTHVTRIHCVYSVKHQ